MTSRAAVRHSLHRTALGRLNRQQEPSKLRAERRYRPARRTAGSVPTAKCYTRRPVALGAGVTPHPFEPETTDLDEQNPSAAGGAGTMAMLSSEVSRQSWMSFGGALSFRSCCLRFTSCLCSVAARVNRPQVGGVVCAP